MCGLQFLECRIECLLQGRFFRVRSQDVSLHLLDERFTRNWVHGRCSCRVVIATTTSLNSGGSASGPKMLPNP